MMQPKMRPTVGAMGLVPVRLIMGLSCALVISCKAQPSNGEAHPSGVHDVSCISPSGGSQVLFPNQPAARDLAGDYTIRIVVESSATGNIVVQGRMTLGSADRAGRDSGAQAGFLLEGWTDANLHALGQIDILYSPSSRDPKKPGVYAILRPEGNLVLVIGGLAQDRGVFFSILESSSSGFKGRWQDGGLRIGKLHGYFCAERAG